MQERKRALVAMSGGVDSSVAAWLAQREGFECEGVTMRLFDNGTAGVDWDSGCCSLEDVEDARAAAARLGIRFHVADMSRAFQERVIHPFALCYLRGETPNPCIECNRRLKFDLLWERARVLGCETLVTGHYARVAYRNGRWHLLRALDLQKDQSYFLYTLTQESLARTRFPLGGLRKEETRRIAQELGLTNARKRDSQDICFAPDGDYARIVERFGGTSPEGNFVDAEGHVLGRHRGISHYTLGQRRGLGISAGERVYVCAIRPEDHTVVLGPNEALFSDVLLAWDFNWISGEAPAGEIPVQAKIRYRHIPQSALALAQEDGRVRVRFQQPQRAITPGQSVVLYQGEEVLGGGIILGEKPSPSQRVGG